MTKAGTTLEAAFIDPAYANINTSPTGNDVELQASPLLMARSGEADNPLPKYAGDDSSDNLHKPIKIRHSKVTTTETKVKYRGLPFWKCCKQEETVVLDTHKTTDEAGLQKDLDEQKRQIEEKKRRKKEFQDNVEGERHARVKAEQDRNDAVRRKHKEERYDECAEGILIYRLDTSDRLITLLSPPNELTNMNTLVRKATIMDAYPSECSSRRGICIVDERGKEHTLTTSEQRTAIAWLEAMDMMLTRDGKGGRKKQWKGEGERPDGSNKIEEDYLNLALYSNTLIRTDAIGKKKSKRAVEDEANGGVYYNVASNPVNGEEVDEETFESIAKRRAVIKDSWDFYRMICSLLRDRRKYDEAYTRMKLDKVYPYLNSMNGLNDPGDNGYDSAEKDLIQPNARQYQGMGPSRIAKAMMAKAEEALPSLVEICKALAGSLGMEEVGVGPTKEVSAAIKKAERKYNGNLLQVTDYCRALLVVKDFPTLLALLELARDSFGPLIKRVKLSALKDNRKSLVGGYRDVKINLELKEHICEIQVHLWPMWLVCGVDGFRHYRHCLEYNTDTFENPYDALYGLDRKTRAEIIVMAEEAVALMPLETLEWYHEKYILDYFAEAGLFLEHGLVVWAETTLRQLIKLRTESPDIGMDHHETLQLQKYLEESLRKQDKTREADEIAERLAIKDREKKKEEEEVEQSLLDMVTDPSCFNPAEMFESIMDPNKKERETEQRARKEIRASKKHWRNVRQQRFPFLDADLDASGLP